MMPCVGPVDAGRGHTHAAQPEPDLERAPHRFPIVRPANVKIRTLGGWHERGRAAGRQDGKGGQGERSQKSSHGSFPCCRSSASRIDWLSWRVQGIMTMILSEITDG